MIRIVDTKDLLPLLLASTVLSAVVAGAISLVGQSLTLRHQARETAARARDSARQRVRENSEFMMSLITIAHGTPADGRRNLAVGEQLAAIELIVANANEYPELRRATDIFLTTYVAYAVEKAEAGDNAAQWTVLARQVLSARQGLDVNQDKIS